MTSLMAVIWVATLVFKSAYSHEILRANVENLPEDVAVKYTRLHVYETYAGWGFILVLITDALMSCAVN